MEFFDLVTDLQRPHLHVGRHKVSGLPLLVEINENRTQTRMHYRDPLNESTLQVVCPFNEANAKIAEIAPLLTKPDASSKESVWFEVMVQRYMEETIPSMVKTGIVIGALLGGTKRPRTEGEEEN